MVVVVVVMVVKVAAEIKLAAAVTGKRQEHTDGGQVTS